MFQTCLGNPQNENLNAGTKINKSSLLFSKIEDEIIENQILKLKS